ncbi:MAG: GNAT family N-acetyltransferase [Bacillota bacterium]
MYKYYFKAIDKSEMSFLEDMLYHAIYIRDNETLPRSIIYEPNLYKYIKNWDEKHDIGYIIIEQDTNRKLGAAWIRAFNEENKGYGYIDDGMPELSIALYPEYRGKGAGTALLQYLIDHLPVSTKSISLSVNVQNPAKRLYERVGFKTYLIKEDTAIMLFNRTL